MLTVSCLASKARRSRAARGESPSIVACALSAATNQPPNSLLAIQLNPDRDGLADRSLIQSKGMNVRRRGAFCEGHTLYAELDDLEAPICYGKLIISRA